MAPTRRRQSLSVIERLKHAPYRFEFFQAVRLLECAVITEPGACAVEPIGSAAPPGQELLRFKAQTSMAFGGGEVTQVVERNLPEPGAHGEARKQWSMEVAFGGLIGSQGVMPFYLTEVVHRELKAKNTALKDFLDIFNHRHFSLLYRAWQKYQLPAIYEQGRLRQGRNIDLFSLTLASIAGLGTDETRYRMAVPDEALYGMAGHLGRQQCSAVALASMVRQYFGLVVSIEQFQGQWDALPEDVQTRLPGPDMRQGVNTCLGRNTLLGSECFQAQNKFRVVVEPMDYEDYMTLAPGSDKLEALKSFIQFAAGIEMDFEISVTLHTGQVAPVQLASESEHLALLGWNTHMASDSQHDTLVTIRLSADQVSPDEALPAA